MAAAKHHEFGAAHSAIKTSSDRSFGLVFGTFFALLAVHNWWREGSLWWLYGTLAALIFLIAYTKSEWLAPFNKIWTRLGLLLGAVVSPIVLGLFYFLIMTPIGALMRMSGKDVLRLRPDRKAKSYWIAHSSSADDSMTHQF